MIKNKAYKFRLYPNERQKEYFAKCFGSVRFIYNKMLEERITLYEKYKDDKEQLNLHKPKTRSEYRKEYDWLYEVDKYVLDYAEQNLKTAFNLFFKKINKFPQFKSKHRDKDNYTTWNTNKNFRIENGYIFIPKAKFVKVVQHREIPDNQRIKSYNILKTKTNKYYVCINVEWEEDNKPFELDFSKAIGLDYSSPYFYVDSQNIKGNYPKFYCMAEERLSKQHRKLSKCVKGSKNREKQRLKYAKLCEKVANRRKDWLEKLSCKIAKQYDIVCVENLNMEAMSKLLNLFKNTKDNSWSMFIKMLERKVKKVVKVDKRFPSSKLCPKCGCVNKDLTLNDRVWTCSCGAVLDRDYNAANNILNEGLRLLQA